MSRQQTLTVLKQQTSKIRKNILCAMFIALKGIVGMMKDSFYIVLVNLNDIFFRKTAI